MDSKYIIEIIERFEHYTKDEQILFPEMATERNNALEYCKLNKLIDSNGLRVTDKGLIYLNNHRFQNYLKKLKSKLNESKNTIELEEIIETVRSRNGVYSSNYYFAMIICFNKIFENQHVLRIKMDNDSKQIRTKKELVDFIKEYDKSFDSNELKNALQQRL